MHFFHQYVKTNVAALGLRFEEGKSYSCDVSNVILFFIILGSVDCC